MHPTNPTLMGLNDLPLCADIYSNAAKQQQGYGERVPKSRSLSAAMALPINKGKSADEVQKDMESLGYTVTKP